MLQKLNKRKSEGASTISGSRQQGFTIIEVLIVLAIAGLIMVIVFLAVPALQRSQRNQSRKTDVNNTLSGVADFTSNNGGTPPAAQADITTVSSNVKYGYYPAAQVFYNSSAATPPGASVASSVANNVANKATVDTINVYVGMICTSATASPTATGANARNVAILYVVEQASGTGLLQCVSS